MGFRVDLDHLDQVTTRIAALQGFVQDSLTGVDQRVTAMHLTWSGTAADRHAEAHHEWAQGAADVHDGIETMRNAAATAHGAYTEGIAANLRMLGQA
ncbi:WXG100 family type VII secretion target [Nocardia sp. NPDC057440]|uniref:WXG100 family type VII secretion target n=1 Tax=Nocardia sp. NPDC057440 TaxID=3346134 RepID=UPI00366FED78